MLTTKNNKTFNVDFGDKDFNDSSVFANAGVPSGMIFVRNDKGSHNPHEAMDFDDFFQATEILNGAMQTAARDRKEYRS